MNWAVKILSSHYGCINFRATSLNLSYLTLNIIINYGGVLAQPNKKGPIKTVDIFCSSCKTQLFKYRKGGKGALVKCFKERISQDFTKIPCICPSCERAFARPALIRGAPAYKMIGGKVTFK